MPKGIPKGNPKGAPQGKPAKGVVKNSGKAVVKTTKNKKDSAEVGLNIKTKDASKNGDIPIPEGATEEDIRVIRNANKMRVAEKRLGEIM